jgi:excisionase family DNA binding protein
MTREPWSGLVLAVSEDRALVGPEAAALVLRLIVSAERVATRDGIGLSPQLRHMRDVLWPLAARSGGHTDVRPPARPPSWAVDDITINEAATMLQRSPRHTRRLVASGSLGAARKTGRAWSVARAEVAAYALHTQNQKETS